MARISIYGLDLNVSLLDKWIGTDSDGSVTKNFTAQAISDLFNQASAIAIAGQNNFQFQTISNDGRRNGTISFNNFGGNNTALSALTNIKISERASSQKIINDYISTLVGKYVILTQADEPNNFGIYKLTGFTRDLVETTFFNATLEFVASHGQMVSEKYYCLAVYPGFIFDTSFADKTFVHNQTIPASQWDVQHNLDKFPSVTVTLPSGKVGFADVQYIDENNLTITFAGDETGKAYMN